MNKYLKPLFEEIIIDFEDVILSSTIDVKETNATFSGTPDEII